MTVQNAQGGIAVAPMSEGPKPRPFGRPKTREALLTKKTAELAALLRPPVQPKKED